MGECPSPEKNQSAERLQRPYFSQATSVPPTSVRRRMAQVGAPRCPIARMRDCCEDGKSRISHGLRDCPATIDAFHPAGRVRVRPHTLTVLLWISPPSAAMASTAKPRIVIPSLAPHNTRLHLQGAPQRLAAKRPHLRALSGASRCYAARGVAYSMISSGFLIWSVKDIWVRHPEAR